MQANSAGFYAKMILDKLNHGDCGSLPVDGLIRPERAVYDSAEQERLELLQGILLELRSLGRDGATGMQATCRGLLDHLATSDSAPLSRAAASFR